MDSLEERYKMILMKEHELKKREEKLNEMEREINNRESGLFHYYKDFIDSLQEQSFKHVENHHCPRE